VIAIDVARRQQRERDWGFLVRRRLLPRHPYQLFLPHDLATGEIIHPCHQGDIDFAALHTSDQRRRQRAVQFDLHPRKGLSKNLEDRRQHECGVEIRRAEHDMSLDIRGGQLGQQLVMKSQYRLGIGKDGLAIGGEKQLAAFMGKDRLPGEFFEPLQLKGDRRLSPPEPSRGLRNASGLDDRSQRAEHPDIQVDEVH